MTTITQLSIFVNNQPGGFAYITSILKECGVNLKAFNIAESSGFGVFRAISDDPLNDFEKLKEKNILVKVTQVVTVKMDDRPGGLFTVAKALGDNNINIEYAYAYTSGKNSAVFFKVDNPQLAIDSLKKSGLTILTEKDL